MEITINGVSYKFSFRGFGPQYTYELIMGEPYDASSKRSFHMLQYATLIACNAESFKMTFADFSEWLYDHPAEERAMADAIAEESVRRMNLAANDKKKE